MEQAFASINHGLILAEVALQIMIFVGHKGSRGGSSTKDEDKFSKTLVKTPPPAMPLSRAVIMARHNEVWEKAKKYDELMAKVKVAKDVAKDTAMLLGIILSISALMFIVGLILAGKREQHTALFSNRIGDWANVIMLFPSVMMAVTASGLLQSEPEKNAERAEIETTEPKLINEVESNKVVAPKPVQTTVIKSDQLAGAKPKKCAVCLQREIEEDGFEMVNKE